MTQMRHSILLILSIVAVALAAVLVILAPHNRALPQPGLSVDAELDLEQDELSFSELGDEPS